MNKLIYTLFLTGSFLASQAQEIRWNTPGAGNPFIPGYFADPTVKKFGDTYYIYATTDGSGAGFGPSQLWCSKDFENWTLMPMNWPDSHWIWAPDVMQSIPTERTACFTASRATSTKGWQKRRAARGKTFWAKARQYWFPTVS